MFAFSKRLIFDLGFNEIPFTLAPNSLSKIESQLPLNPVCPVIRTFLFFQNFLNWVLFKINPRFSKGHYFDSKVTLTFQDP